MTTVRQLIQTKGNDVWAVAPGSSVRDVLQTMIDKNVGALPVVDGDNLVGIISERDYARKVVLAEEMSLDSPVGDIMTTMVCFVEPEQTLDDCMALMTDKRVRHLPVLSNGKLVGIVSIGDVVKEIISKQEFMIEQLEHYIAGTIA